MMPPAARASLAGRVGLEECVAIGSPLRAAAWEASRRGREAAAARSVAGAIAGKRHYNFHN